MSHALTIGKIYYGFKIIREIGRGGFGEIFYAQDLETEDFYALKIEKIKSEKRALNYEQRILKALQGCCYIPKFYKFARTHELLYLAMECYGPSLNCLREKNPSHVFSLSTTLRLAIEMIRCIREIHFRGYIHRDIKPDNFLLRRSRFFPIGIIDFGLARKFLDYETNQNLPMRDHPGYVGTNRYASINAHMRLELSQRDDLMSWLFSIVEMRNGKLPWKGIKDRLKTMKKKQQTSPEKLLKKLPQKQFKKIYNYIQKLDNFEVPNYDLLIALIVQTMKENECSWDEPYDWELLDPKVLDKITSINLRPSENDEPNIPFDLPSPDFPENNSNSDEDKTMVDGGCNACNIF